MPFAECAGVAEWPGAIHQGHGQIVPIVDERASPAQREALLRIMSGLDTEPGATLFQVFSATWEKVHNPVFAKIELEADVNGRRAHIKVPGYIEARGEPILNPITGKEHRARINLPAGFEYEFAEAGRDHAIAACGPRRGTWEPRVEATSLTTLIQMVEGGLGVTLLPTIALEGGLLKSTRLVARPFSAKAPSRTLALVSRRTSPRRADADLLAEFLVEHHRRSNRK